MDCVICPRLIVGACGGEPGMLCATAPEVIESFRAESEPQEGDILLTSQGVRGARVVVRLTDDDRVVLRPLAGGMDDAYSSRRPPRGMAWALLARGGERYVKGARHVR